MKSHYFALIKKKMTEEKTMIFGGARRNGFIERQRMGPILYKKSKKENMEWNNRPTVHHLRVEEQRQQNSDSVPKHYTNIN